KGFTPKLNEFFVSAELVDILDSITVIAEAMGAATRSDNLRRSWIEFVERALEEEAVQYTIDEEGGIHRRVDAAFEAQTQATVAALSGQRYSAARTAFENAEQELLGTPPDTKDAVQDLLAA